jgi:hypothetical protein
MPLTHLKRKKVEGVLNCSNVDFLHNFWWNVTQDDRNDLQLLNETTALADEKGPGFDDPGSRSQKYLSTSIDSPKRKTRPFRVTRLVDNFFLWAVCLIYKSSPNCCATFVHGTSRICMLTFFPRNGVGYMLGDFFTNSSGHPAPIPWILVIECFLRVPYKMRSVLNSFRKVMSTYL